MIVEDGTGLAGADSYLSEAEFEAYAEARGYTIPSGDVEAALVRASDWIDARYGRRFPGVRVNGRNQGRAWPIYGGYDRSGTAIADDAVPVEIKRATAEAALRELENPRSLSPDIVPISTSGGAIKRVSKQIGPLKTETEYTEGATVGSSIPVFTLIDDILAPLLSGSAAMVPLLRA